MEAGCHDGSDSLRLLDLNDYVVIHAFEPDPQAFAAARNNVKSPRFQLSSFALMEIDGTAKIIPFKNSLGTGSSIIKILNHDEIGPLDQKDYVQCRRLDSLNLTSNPGRGAFWIDVEGAEINLIKGSIDTLRKVDVVQIEVVMHDMSEVRVATWRELNTILIKNGFSLCNAPTHPGFFGDCIYVRSSCLSLRSRVRAKFLHILMISLHIWIYPLLKKPLLE